MTWPPLPSDALGDFESARQALLAALAGLKEEQCRSHPEPDADSVLDCLGVLVAYERGLSAAAIAGQVLSAALAPAAEREAKARGAQLMMPALVHDLNAATNDLRSVLLGLDEEPRKAAVASIVHALTAATDRVNRNAELLGIR